jgi:hypothetical protein
VRIRIEGGDLPGRRPGHEADVLRLGNAHVGLQRRAEVVGLFRADAESAHWECEIAVREIDGLLDVGGPCVHGRPGARFLYLSWGNVDGSTFSMFRRAKLLFGDVPTGTLRSAYENEGLLVGNVGLTQADGTPLCARVRPPAIEWRLR